MSKVFQATAAGVESVSQIPRPKISLGMAVLNVDAQKKVCY